MADTTIESYCDHGINTWFWNCIDGKHYRTANPAGSKPPAPVPVNTDRYTYRNGRQCCLPGPCTRHVHTEVANV